MKDLHSPKNTPIADIKPATDNSRRQFFKKATIGAALITTISSRPVLAGQCNLSGDLSNNASNQDPNFTCDLAGYSHGGWKADSNNDNGAARAYYGVFETGYNTSRVINYNSKLKRLFGGRNLPDAQKNSYTIQDALDKEPLAGFDSNFVAQITAAALNAALWQYAIGQCTDPQSQSCKDVISDLDSTFYWPKTVADYRSDFKNTPIGSQGAYATTIDDFLTI